MFRLEYLNAFKVSLEHSRARVNEELIETLHEFELDQSAHFDGTARNVSGKNASKTQMMYSLPPDRKKEIKEQIENLQKGLDRQKLKRKSNRKR